MPDKKEVLLVFARAPEPGRVKTRLANDVGQEKALDYYKIFVSQTLAASGEWAENQGAGPGSARRETWVCYTPAEGEALVKNWLGREYIFLAQAGSDLGDRMARAMADAFGRGAAKVVLVGTDIPDMEAGHLEAAFKALDRTAMVWGPSLDGGYWLAGASSPSSLERVFTGIPWGTDGVFERTVQRCREAELTWTALPALRDVDTLQDLKHTRFYEKFKG